MTFDHDAVFIAGTIFTIAVSALFLICLHLGLRRQVWWPFAFVVVAWLIAMVAYSGWDASTRQESGRKRATEISVATLPGAAVTERG